MAWVVGDSGRGESRGGTLETPDGEPSTKSGCLINLIKRVA